MSMALLKKPLSRIKTVSYTLRYMAGKPIGNDRMHVLVACMPKSGSSFLTRAIGGLPAFRVASIVQGYDRNEQELSELALLRFHSCNYATQNHVRYSQPVEQLMGDFNLTPLVLTRDIHDVVVSMRDHLRKVSRTWPLAYVPADLPERPDVEVDMFVADMMVPWYLNFLMCWRQCPDAVWVRYEDLADDPNRTVRYLARCLDLHVSPSDVDRAVAAAQKTELKTRNVGGRGRGRDLTMDVKTRISDLAAYYSDVSESDPLLKKLIQESVFDG